jgi:hypothetical protein
VDLVDRPPHLEVALELLPVVLVKVLVFSRLLEEDYLEDKIKIHRVLG